MSATLLVLAALPGMAAIAGNPLALQPCKPNTPGQSFEYVLVALAPDETVSLPTLSLHHY